MGMMTEMRLELWRQDAGVEIPDLQTQELWRKLQKQCFEAIKIAELEVSGIRDGDGYWHGSDVVGGILGDLEHIVLALKARASGGADSGTYFLSLINKSAQVTTLSSNREAAGPIPVKVKRLILQGLIEKDVKRTESLGIESKNP
jgi:hypothetical protein